MATLDNLIKDRLAKSFPIDEENLEPGEIYAFCSARQFGCFTNCFAWYAPGAGTAIVEIWGSGGSVGCQCCCNFSVGSQSGAYAKKTVTMAAGGYVCGNTGHPCMPNAQSFCYAGCSEATCVSICLGTASTCSCMCAQGGHTGLQACRTSTSAMCCLQSCCFAALAQPSGVGAGCGVICGCRNTYMVATAYGGDVNCPGTYSCNQHWTCDTSSNTDYLNASNAIPHGQFTSPGYQATGMHAGDNGNSGGQAQSGQWRAPSMNAKGALGRSVTSFWPSTSSCWNSGKICACYEAMACVPFVPPGQGSTQAMGCPDVRDVGSRGGNGYVRIHWTAS